MWVERTKPMGVRSEAGDTDRVVYGLRKFVHLALKGYPTILLAFFIPPEYIRTQDADGKALQTLAPRVVSQKAYEPFCGYMHQQHERLLGTRGQRNVTRPELVNAFGYDTKYAAHIVRLGLQGEELLQSGKITLPMPPTQRQIILDIRQGKHTLAEVSQMITAAQNPLQSAFASTSLPEQPDAAHVQHWMIERYLAAWTNVP